MRTAYHLSGDESAALGTAELEVSETQAREKAQVAVAPGSPAPTAACATQ